VIYTVNQVHGNRQKRTTTKKQKHYKEKMQKRIQVHIAYS